MKESTTPKTLLKINDPAVSSTMTIAGNIVNRLANNSNTCKTMCLTIVGAMIALKQDISKFPICIVIVMILLFGLLDMFYVHLKFHVSQECNRFRDDVLAGKEVTPYHINSLGFTGHFKGIFTGHFSISTLIFYLVMICVILALKYTDGLLQFIQNLICAT